MTVAANCSEWRQYRAVCFCASIGCVQADRDRVGVLQLIYHWLCGYGSVKVLMTPCVWPSSMFLVLFSLVTSVGHIRWQLVAFRHPQRYVQRCEWLPHRSCLLRWSVPCGPRHCLKCVYNVRASFYSDSQCLQSVVTVNCSTPFFSWPPRTSQSVVTVSCITPFFSWPPRTSILMCNLPRTLYDAAGRSACSA